MAVCPEASLVAVCLVVFLVEACQEAPTPCSAVRPLYKHSKRSVAHL